MEVRTYRVPQIGAGTMADPFRPKYITEATNCGRECGQPCGVIHTATCEQIGVDGAGKAIMREMPTDAWTCTFRCHDALWALLDADPSCVLLKKHACAILSEDVKALHEVAKGIVDTNHPAVVAFVAARKAFNDEQARHVAEARALVGVK